MSILIQLLTLMSLNLKIKIEKYDSDVNNKSKVMQRLCCLYLQYFQNFHQLLRTLNWLQRFADRFQKETSVFLLLLGWLASLLYHPFSQPKVVHRTRSSMQVNKKKLHLDKNKTSDPMKKDDNFEPIIFHFKTPKTFLAISNKNKNNLHQKE